jgi:GTP-binding protein LepA
MSFPLERIRNFSIIAHIDHGKSTLADRILEITGALQEREMQAQVLDKMDIERERGITIKAQTVRLRYTASDGKEYRIHLIDTPGHVDFNYEVSRSLSACEGAILVVDSTQGVEAQTLANVYLALDQGLEILPVLNKVDLPSSDVDRTKEEIEQVIGLDTAESIACSGKTGVGVADILAQIVKKVPPPKEKNPGGPLRALIFDSWYDSYRGAVVMVRVIDGVLKKGDKVRFMATKRDYEVVELGVFTPHASALEELGPGEVGFFAANIRSVHDTKIGDTVTTAKHGSTDALPGFKDVKPMVFAGIFPTDSAQYPDLRDALDKLHMNDSAFSFEPDTSEALGFGFRCGFLGLLHMEIIQERLEREFNLDLITTAPSVVYQVTKRNGELVRVENPAKLPEPQFIEKIEEPISKVTIHVPSDYVGAVISLCQEKRGQQISLTYASKERVIVIYELPFSEVLFDFHDKLKTVSRGYASMDYEFIEYRADALVKIDILVNGEPLDALSIIVHRDRAHHRGRGLCEKLKEFVPQQQYEVALQAAIGSKIIARETVRALRKDVTAKCYGGDISRKRKLLEKQKEGKKRMKSVGNVDVPQEAFLAILKVDSLGKHFHRGAAPGHGSSSSQASPSGGSSSSTSRASAASSQARVGSSPSGGSGGRVLRRAASCLISDVEPAPLPPVAALAALAATGRDDARSDTAVGQAIGSMGRGLAGDMGSPPKQNIGHRRKPAKSRGPVSRGRKQTSGAQGVDVRVTPERRHALPWRPPGRLPGRCHLCCARRSLVPGKRGPATLRAPPAARRTQPSSSRLMVQSPPSPDAVAPADPLASMLEQLNADRQPLAQVHLVERLSFGPVQQVERYRLGNGLVLLLLVDRSAPVFSYHTWFSVGSRHERRGKTGLAHLFEHLMFNETENLPARAFDQKLEEAGAESNAATWFDWTYYHENMPADQLGLVVELEAERMARLVLREPQLKSEKEVVANERRQRVDDDVDGSVNELLWKTAFTKHAYSWPTIGWMEDIENFTTEDCEAFYRTYYAPNNATVVVVGDVDRAALLTHLQDRYGQMPSSSIPVEDMQPEPPQIEERRLEVEKPTATEKVVLGYKGPALGDFEHAALSVVNEALFGGRASRLHRVLVQQSELAIDCQGWVSSFRDPGLYEISSTARTGITAEKLLEAVDRELARVVSEPLTEQELARVKARMELGTLQAMETVGGKAYQIGFWEVVAGDPNGAFLRLAHMRRITATDALRAARRYLVESARTVVLVRAGLEDDGGDEEDGDERGDASGAEGEVAA